MCVLEHGEQRYDELPSMAENDQLSAGGMRCVSCGNEGSSREMNDSSLEKMMTLGRPGAGAASTPSG